MADAPRHNLPAEPNRFVGRERDIGDLCAMFDETRAVTLCGVGGIGKTRLALRVAHRLLDDFADGVWAVELAKISRPELVMQEIAEVFGLESERGRDLTDAVVTRLAGSSCLVLLDNCEHLVEATAHAAAALMAGCPGIRVLATSREALRISGELIWHVPPLDLPGADPSAAESVQLFLNRARAAGTQLGEESLPDVARLCRALDGLPLAIELAAARTRMLSPGQIADRIDDRFALLTSGDRTAPARQRTLAAAVEWSHDLLSEAEKTLLRRLSVLAGGFDLDLVERVCAEPPLSESRMVTLLGALVDKSLVVCDEDRGRFRLLDTIRQFAAERLADSDEERMVRDLHLRVLCKLQERAFDAEFLTPGVTWRERLAAHTGSRDRLADQRAALEWALRSGNVTVGLRLCMRSSGLLSLGGSAAEVVGWVERLLRQDLSLVAPEQIGLAKGYMAYGLLTRDDLDSGLAAAREGLAGMAGDPFVLATAHTVAGGALLRMGRGDEATAHIDGALAVARDNGDRFNEAGALIEGSIYSLQRGRQREAQRGAEEAYTVASAHGHPWILAMAASHLGLAAETRGDLEAAAEHYDAAISWLRELGNRGDLAQNLARSGRVCAQLGDLAAARERLAEAVATARECGLRQAMNRCLVSLSALARAEGDLESAVLASSAVAALRESMGQRTGSVKVDELLSAARAKLGEGRTTSLWSMGRSRPPFEVATQVLEGRRPEPAAGPVQVEPVRGSLLTTREQEIAGMLTRGLSNKAIAEELVISPATVARHIANIMDKLGYTSRAQIAVWAADHGVPSA
ncbi:LuxR C-terminal-related transcriptional regulator [Nonomuraea sp. NPDC050547]|uniref:LuxR C-terminal-related transcriptional regulator n=1 Tax=unclassified Nonomuraea TaxID=2593643 RepID=UPI0037943D6E